MKQRIRWIIFILFILIIKSSPSIASEENRFNLTNNEIVFLFDSSSSMDIQDKNKEAVDAVRQAIYSVPVDYQIGFVAYHTGIQLIIPFGEGLEQWDRQLETIAYSGYTNAGEGLYQAMKLFSEKEDINRSIIMLTDGEIDMPNSQEKENARALYQEMIQKAKEKGIKIYIIAVGSQWSDTEVHIFDGAEQTDGAIYWEGQSGSLSEIIKRILYDRINFPKNTVEVAEYAEIEYSDKTESSIKHGFVDLELSMPKAEQVRIVLLSDNEFSQVEAEYQAKSGRIVTGQHFAAVDLIEPEEEHIAVYFQVSDLSKVEAYFIAEYTAKVETQVVYRKVEVNAQEQQGKKVEEPYFQNFADISFYLTDKDGVCLWDSGNYEGREVLFTINGVLETGVISDGKVLYSMQIDGVEKADITVDTSTFPEQLKMIQASPVFFSLPEDPVIEPEPDYWMLQLIIFLLILCLVGIVIAFFRMKNKKNTVIFMEQGEKAGLKELAQKKDKKDYTYTGKLNLYVVKTQSEQDIPPQTYRLFGKQSKEITLYQILNTCSISLGDIGAEGISFYPGSNHSLIVIDQSEGCTILRGMEIVKKGVGYPIYYNGKLTVTFEDGVTEMEIHYKNLKPSEQEEDYK